MMELADGTYQVKAERCPENYGFNVIKLAVPAPETTITVDFKGLQGEDADPDGYPGYQNTWWYQPNYRYGFVGITQEGSSILSDVGRTDFYNQTSSVSFTLPAGQQLKYLWLVVTAGPKDANWTLSALPMAQWPYTIKLTNTTLQ